MEATPERVKPPRVLILMADQWPRALLRAELLEAGYDAVGARSLEEAVALLALGKERGGLRVVVADQGVVESAETVRNALSGAGPGPDLILLASVTGTSPSGPWTRVLRRPVTLGQIVAEVRTHLRPNSSGG